MFRKYSLFGDQFEAQKENGTNAEKQKLVPKYMVTDTLLKSPSYKNHGFGETTPGAWKPGEHFKRTQRL